MRKIIFAFLVLSSALILCACTKESTKTNIETTINTAPVLESSEEPTHSLEETIQLSLSKYETQVIFRQMYFSTMTLLEDILSATNYWNDTDFDTIAEIRHLESMWSDMSDMAQEMADEINENTPASEYEEYWNEYKTIINELPAVFASCSNLDPNNDGEYCTEEMLPLLRDAKSNATAMLEESGHITMKIPIPSQITPPQQTESCVVCGSNASRFYTNPFSNEEEPYCETHYQAIIDMMGEMEADVGDSEYSKHKCEECSREGTHVYYSFTGQIEYYCTQHYEELTDMLEDLGLE